MKIKNKLFLVFLVLSVISALALRQKPQTAIKVESICLSSEEQKLYKLIMDYRKQKKLPAIRISAALTKVAQAHAYDLSANKPYTNDNRCNFHSWSSKGTWSSCCYGSDHKQASCMWDKPREIAGFESDGFEIAYGSPTGDKVIVTAENAVEAWKTSTGHNNVMVNKSIWKDYKWQSIGIGMYKNFACVWFAADGDKETVLLCK